ncbi:WD40 repeat-like protein, partial [Rhizodiscina lignyota]
SSSPPSMPASRTSRKPKKPPPITPKRFNRFFTPRTSASMSSSRALGKSGRQLRDITRSGANRRSGSGASNSSALGKRTLFEDIDTNQDTVQTPQLSSRKRRKGLATPESSPLQSSPLRRRGSNGSDISVFEDIEEEIEAGSDNRIISNSLLSEPVFPKPVRRAKCLGVNGRIVSRSFGGASALGRGMKQDHCSGWGHQTTNFYSEPGYRYPFQSPYLPFCVASGNCNDLIAVGDEFGGIMCLNSTMTNSQNQVHTPLHLNSHSNAVMDIAFSPDDALLASASGDQQVHITDLTTSKIKFVLSGHISTVRQVRFQPGNNNVLATSGRDGNVLFWDLRCSGRREVIQLRDPSTGGLLRFEKPLHLNTYNTIPDAHAEVKPLQQVLPPQTKSRDIPPPGILVGRRGDISITSIAFLGQGREHLLLTGSEASTSVRLWDIRGRCTRYNVPTPISYTALPDAHSAHRHYGINSILLNSDESRFYTLSRDSTIYAYSTSHLILGSAPELSISPSSTPQYRSTGKTGLGPIYGFRHPRFHATSFYVKAALRKATDSQPELLAVGSSDACPVLFPTDEKFLNRPVPQEDEDEDDDDLPSLNSTISEVSQSLPSRPAMRRMLSSTSLQTRPADTIPIYELGTPLVRGHEREVTSVSWTSRGDLVSLSDDYSVRVWKEGEKARELRMGGEVEGRRWGCGWAEVPESWDEDDD